MPVQPTLDPLPPRTIHPGQTLSFVATVNNPDSVAITFATVPSPDPTFPNANLNPNSGQFSWPVPPNHPLGPQVLTVQISDQKGPVDSRQCTVTVANQPPVMAQPMNATTHPGRTLMFAVNALDPDWDPLTFSIVPDPNNPFPGAMITSMGGIGSFTWSVPQNQPLGALVLTLRVTDPFGASDTKQCTITVANDPPVMAQPMNVSTHPGNLLTFGVNALDPDWDPLTFSIVPDPSNPFPGAMINGMGGIGMFTWSVPQNQPLGALVLTLRVTDPFGASDTKQCTVTVANDPPVMAPLPNRSGHQGDLITLSAMAMDMDWDPLTFSIVPDPSNPFPGAMITSMGGVGMFSWTVPQNHQPGALILTLKVSDPYGGSDQKQCVITVL